MSFDQSAYFASYYQEHKEEIDASNRQYVETHRDEIRAYQREYQRKRRAEGRATKLYPSWLAGVKPGRKVPSRVNVLMGQD